MWLVDARTGRLQEFFDSDVPSYAILSHRWGPEEVSFTELQQLSESILQKRGFTKIKACCDQAVRDGLDWAWIDTCCIDKRNSADLSEAINSMYRYYRDSEVCYAYLEDVTEDIELGRVFDDLGKSSDWFTRGWTLQELIAPRRLTFYSAQWIELGHRDSLAHRLSRITSIPEDVLQGASVTDYSVAQRFSWSSRRRTTRVEDAAYCLLGLMQVSIPLLYGEGENAFIRLQKEIIKTSADQSIFCWASHSRLEPHENVLASKMTGILAASPALFEYCATCRASSAIDHPYAMTNLGLSIRLPLQEVNEDEGPVWIASLRGTSGKGVGSVVGNLIGGYVCLKRLYGNQYARITCRPWVIDHDKFRLTSIFVAQRISLQKLDQPSTTFGALLRLENPEKWLTVPIWVFCDLQSAYVLRAIQHHVDQYAEKRQIMMPWSIQQCCRKDTGHALVAFAFEHNGIDSEEAIMIIVEIGADPDEDHGSELEHLWVRWSMRTQQYLMHHNEGTWETTHAHYHSIGTISLNYKADALNDGQAYEYLDRGQRYSMRMDWEWAELSYLIEPLDGSQRTSRLRIRCRTEMQQQRPILAIEASCAELNQHTVPERQVRSREERHVVEIRQPNKSSLIRRRGPGNAQITD